MSTKITDSNTHHIRVRREDSNTWPITITPAHSQNETVYKMYILQILCSSIWPIGHVHAPSVFDKLSALATYIWPSICRCSMEAREINSRCISCRRSSTSVPELCVQVYAWLKYILSVRVTYYWLIHLMLGCSPCRRPWRSVRAVTMLSLSSVWCIKDTFVSVNCATVLGLLPWLNSLICYC